MMNDAEPNGRGGYGMRGEPAGYLLGRKDGSGTLRKCPRQEAAVIPDQHRPVAIARVRLDVGRRGQRDALKVLKREIIGDNAPPAVGPEVRGFIALGHNRLRSESHPSREASTPRVGARCRTARRNGEWFREG